MNNLKKEKIMEIAIIGYISLIVICGYFGLKMVWGK
jgi:hypothetical protein